jgi:ectonucleotide pyrophosphatase/phosphodiesterase family protein 6
MDNYTFCSFRWDYYSRQRGLPGLSRFMSEGVHAKWVEPIFPSLSYPSWTTIATGQYPEEHNILGNFIIANDNSLNETIFQLKDNSTKMPFWWQSAEPIWTTATRNKRKVYLANWARCDVAYENIRPTECTGYTYQDVNLGFRNELQTALKRLRNGYSLSMVRNKDDERGH